MNASDQVTTIQVKMLDSEPTVKRPSGTMPRLDSESLKRAGAILSDMNGNRDTVLSDFVRFKIREWVASGREQKELAEKAGFKSPSTVAMVKKGQGVGNASSPGFARAFGFSSVAAMVDAAYAWRKGTGAGLERRLADSAFCQAVKMMGSFMVAPTDAEIAAIANDFLEPRFDDRDAKWWFDTLSDELTRDRNREQAATLAKQVEVTAANQRAVAIENAWRGASTQKKRLAELNEPAAEERVEATSHVNELKKPRRRSKAG